MKMRLMRTLVLAASLRLAKPIMTVRQVKTCHYDIEFKMKRTLKLRSVNLKVISPSTCVWQKDSQ